jgi:hypothetical protein
MTPVAYAEIKRARFESLVANDRSLASAGRNAIQVPNQS